QNPRPMQKLRRRRRGRSDRQTRCRLLRGQPRGPGGLSGPLLPLPAGAAGRPSCPARPSQPSATDVGRVTGWCAAVAAATLALRVLPAAGLALPESRRLGNAAYVAWILGFCCAYMAACAFASCLFAALAGPYPVSSNNVHLREHQREHQSEHLSQPPPPPASPFLQLVDQHGLAYFLIGNLLTGLTGRCILPALYGRPDFGPSCRRPPAPLCSWPTCWSSAWPPPGCCPRSADCLPRSGAAPPRPRPGGSRARRPCSRRCICRSSNSSNLSSSFAFKPSAACDDWDFVCFIPQLSMQTACRSCLAELTICYIFLSVLQVYIYFLVWLVSYDHLLSSAVFVYKKLGKRHPEFC
ncbi:hypothetical protein BOX15_Mlig008849g1, partial [Macrostomum lignano]